MLVYPSLSPFSFWLSVCSLSGCPWLNFVSREALPNFCPKYVQGCAKVLQKTVDLPTTAQRGHSGVGRLHLSLAATQASEEDGEVLPNCKPGLVPCWLFRSIWNWQGPVKRRRSLRMSILLIFECILNSIRAGLFEGKSLRSMAFSYFSWGSMSEMGRSSVRWLLFAGILLAAWCLLCLQGCWLQVAWYEPSLGHVWRTPDRGKRRLLWTLFFASHAARWLCLSCFCETVRLFDELVIV